MKKVKEELKELGIGISLYYRVRKENPKLSKEEIIEICKTRSYKRYTLNGQPCTLEKASKILGVSPETINRYTMKGYTLDEAFTKIKENKGKYLNYSKGQIEDIPHYTFQGKQMTTSEIAKIGHVSKSALRARLRKGQDPEQALKEMKACSLKTGESLFTHCALNGYNYNVIVKIMMTGKALSVEEAIDYYLKNGQSSVGSPEKFVGPVLLSHFFLKHKMAPATALPLLNKGMTVENVIERLLFVERNDDYKRSVGEKLYAIYKVVSPLESTEEQLVLLNKIHISAKEKEWFINRCEKITKAKREYLLLSIYDAYVNGISSLRDKLKKDYRITDEESLHIISGDIFDDYSQVYGPKGKKVYIKQPIMIDKK